MPAPTLAPPRGIAASAVVIPAAPPGATGWRRLITHLDPSLAGAYALKGPGLRPGVAYEITAGAVVVVVDRHPGHRQVRMTTAQPGGLEDVHTWTIKSPLGKRVVNYIARRLPATAAAHHARRLEAMPNRYPGRCRHCRSAVPAGSGVIGLDGKGAVHLPGTCPPPPRIITPNQWPGTCGACGGWVQAGEGVAVRLTSPRPVTGGHYEPMHHAPCPIDAPPGPPNRRSGWCADCGELVAPGAGYRLHRRLHHRGVCPEPAVNGPTWIWRVPAGTAAVAGTPAWARLTADAEALARAEVAPGYRVLGETYVELVAVPVEVLPGRIRRTRARVRMATAAEAADLLADRLDAAELARPHATGHRARFAAEKIGEVRPWLAEITGRDAAYGYRREFIPPERDYANVNSRGTRGIVYAWTLGLNRVYETSYSLSRRKTARAFLRATPEGDVVEIAGKEVEAWLDHAAAWVAS